jgi:hypothetical protein
MLIRKILSSIKRHGILKTIKMIFIFPFRKQKEKNFLKYESIQERFEAIYKLNYWGDKESVSGHGSTLKYTENLRKELPGLFKKYSITSLFDAPCGDLNWMILLLAKVNITYIGGDIVSELIESHNLKYKNANTNFIHIDLTKDKFPKVDLMICRDCLFHLSYRDTELVLKNFIKSNISYLLTTTHTNTDNFKNKDISTGSYRKIDLFLPPYSFDRLPIEEIKDWIYPDPERKMCLWSRDQIIQALKNRGC